MKALVFSAASAALFLVAACSSGEPQVTSVTDGGTFTTDGGGIPTEGGIVTDSGTPGVLPTTCDGACKATAVTAKFGAKTGKITRAYVGYTAPANGAPVALYVDFDTQADKGCPTDTNSAGGLKKFTIDLPLPLASSYTKANPDATFGFFDTDSADPWLTAKPIEAASAFTVTPTAAKLTADGFIALDIDATFPSGTVAGHLYAPHCAIFDATP